jgi:hypothetical protein
MTTIKVEFPDGSIREIEAVIRQFYDFKEDRQFGSYIPEPMEGWEFLQIVDGRWIATKARD